MAKKISRCGARLNSEQKVEPVVRKKPEVKKSTFGSRLLKSDTEKKKEDANLDNDIESGVTAENIEKFKDEED